MLRKLLLLLVFFISISLTAQSLSLESKDSLAWVNSKVGVQAEGHIVLKNNSASSKDYYLVRRRVGATGLVDSNYFCWDLCYPTFAGQSQGNVTIGAGSLAYDFSGYAYVIDSGVVGQDTVWYTAINASDLSDSLQVYMIYGFSKTFDVSTENLEYFKIFPNPVGNQNLVVQVAPMNTTSHLIIIDISGRVVSKLMIKANANEIIFNPVHIGLESGFYFLQRKNSQGLWNMEKLLVE